MSEVKERKFPTPEEWNFWTRVQMRSGIAQVAAGSVLTWPSAGERLKYVLERLEDPERDGAGLEPLLREDGGDEGKGVAFDLTSKSEAWRRGYHEVLMGAACCAEHLDGFLFDKTLHQVLPPSYVVGPSNPRPKTIPSHFGPAPREENCRPAYDAPDVFYEKVLMSKGFSTRQRMEAAVAWAEWLDFKGSTRSSKEMAERAVDIALSGLPREGKGLVDRKTGVIRKYPAGHLSHNVFQATTSLAIHHARNQDLSTALPIFLSVLRASRELPPAPPSSLGEQFKTQVTNSDAFLAPIKGLLFAPPYPPAPPTGDEPHTRTQLAICEEAGVMAHIGEILFASAAATSPYPSAGQKLEIRQAGINFTRDAVDIAESTIQATPSQDQKARKKCAECITVGVDNWGKMVGRMVRQAAEQQDEGGQQEKKDEASLWSFPSWLWGSSRSGGGESKEDEKERWEREEQAFGRRRRSLERILREEGLNPEAGHDEEGGGILRKSGAFLFG